jgi:hypothetical protein
VGQKANPALRVKPGYNGYFDGGAELEGKSFKRPMKANLA